MACSNAALKELDKDYWEVVGSSKYLDKSLLIKTLLDSQERMILITAPPGFFKKTNTLMLKCFFNMNHSNLRVTDNPVRLWKYRVFQAMEIGKHLELLDRHLGRYPVLHLNLRKVKCGLDAISFVSLFQSVLQSALSEFISIEQSSNLDLKERKEFHKLAYCKFTDFQLEMSVIRICELLRKHFNEKVIVLIDYYDDLIIRLMNSGNQIRVIVKFFQTLYVELRNNANVNFALLTGETNLLKVEGITEYCFPSYHKFSPYYGVILEDIKSPDALERLVVSDSDSTLDSISFCCTGAGKKKRIYIPWLVLDYDYGIYYFSTLLNLSRGSVVLRNSIVRSTLQRLLMPEIIAIKIKKHLDYDDIYKLYDLCSKRDEEVPDSRLDDETIEVFFAFLVRLGIITETIEMNERIKKRFGFQACTLYFVANDLAYAVLSTLIY